MIGATPIASRAFGFAPLRIIGSRKASTLATCSGRCARDDESDVDESEADDEDRSVHEEDDDEDDDEDEAPAGSDVVRASESGVCPAALRSEKSGRGRTRHSASSRCALP